jgi:hypothetical protein
MKENNSMIDTKMYEIQVALHGNELDELKQIMTATGCDAEETIAIALHGYWTFLCREGLIGEDQSGNA